VEGLAVNRGSWQGRRVFLTGHTGFKGGWLVMWLNSLGAEVHGYALGAPAGPTLFRTCGIERLLAAHTEGDVRDAQRLAEALRRSRAEVVLHLAAQSLVRPSYADPVGTFAINVMGTVHLLDAVRSCGSVGATVIVTSDKCYENDGRGKTYVESDSLGGHDPYSASKGCAEIVAASYARSFLAAAGMPVATARAGNVLGGGDWSDDRLVPDLIRAIGRGQPLEVRAPNATRPWQHVLEPLSGYLLLCERLLAGDGQCAGAWNFGPDLQDVRPVSWVLDELCQFLPGASWRPGPAPRLHEAAHLALDSTKARNGLGWSPRWTLREALRRTAEWHAQAHAGADMARVSLRQIEEFAAAGRVAGSAR
jgi:CDP-glucose 4,6-dehydratase